ncbi:unnamed protein product [Paramecium sonneborni]|uniref:Uncharacterized protein n=1 Tax=Paramecium sonneborni TaxID=65129 RepID=A0A8S1PXE7_9CILI|nr:unnamed protein product [Paramecium sonneborni]
MIFIERRRRNKIQECDMIGSIINNKSVDSYENRVNKQKN